MTQDQTISSGVLIGVAQKQPTAGVMLLVSLLIFSIYTYLPLPLSHSSSVPFGVSIILATILCVVTDQKWDTRIVYLFGWVVFIACTGVITGPHAEPYALQRLATTSFFVASLYVSVIVYYEFATWPAKTLRRFFGILSLVLVVGAFLELFTPVKAVSDFYRNTTGIEGSIYDSDKRDLLDTGIVRPKFFSREPSILSQSIGFVALLWLMLARGKYRFLIFTVVFFAGVAACRSPTMLVLYPAGLFITFLSREPGMEGRRRDLAKRIWLVALVGAIAVVLLLLLASSVMSHRLAGMMAGHDTSSKTRLIFPVLMAAHVLTTYPWFGLGLGGGNAVVDETLKIVASMGLPPTFFIKNGSAGHLFPNLILEYWATFGVIGGVAILYFLRRLQKLTCRNDGAVIVVLMLLLSFNSGFVGGTFFWTQCGLLAAVSFVRWLPVKAAAPTLAAAPESTSDPPALESPA